MRIDMWVRFLGSMNLAVILLLAIAVASIIGTVVVQNQPYTDYLFQFGPFWHEIFRFLGLYDVYNSTWFIFLLGFLVISTSICLYRNTPKLLHGMRQYHVAVQADCLRRLRNNNEWILTAHAISMNSLGALLTSYGYRWRIKQSEQQTILAAKKGTVGRLGYLFTHMGIVLICAGALFDSTLPLKLAVETGKVQVVDRRMATDQAPPTSHLSEANMSFRATLDISEQAGESLAFINYQDGYVVQPLPFTIGLDDFRIEYYANGQPKSYASDLVIYDESLEEPYHETVSVNHPLNYKGYNIYQAGFGDGGSLLRFRAHPLNGSSLEGTSLQGVVGENLELDIGKETATVELIDFRLFNVKPMTENVPGKKFKNLGPSFTFRLRNSDGTAREYLNYMTPMEIEGRGYFISGMREQHNLPWRYLYIPVDKNGGINQFIELANNTRNSALLTKILKQYSADMAGNDGVSASKQIKLAHVLMAIFNKGGYAALEQYLRNNVAADMRNEKREVYFAIIQQILEKMYLDIVPAEHRVSNQAMNSTEKAFFAAAMNALGHSNQYGAPFYLQLTDFEHREASSLEITRSPGKNTVYLGCGLLIVGIFLMFYVPFRRIWIMVWPDNGQHRLLLAGTPHRQSSGFGQEFNALQAEIDTHLRTMEKERQLWS